jgi:N-acetylmuramidase
MGITVRCKLWRSRLDYEELEDGGPETTPGCSASNESTDKEFMRLPELRHPLIPSHKGAYRRPRCRSRTCLQLYNGGTTGEKISMDFQGAGAPVTREGILAVLDTLNLKLPQLLAVVTVETSGCGCFADRRPTILFERHIFSKQTGGEL